MRLGTMDILLLLLSLLLPLYSTSSISSIVINVADAANTSKHLAPRHNRAIAGSDSGSAAIAHIVVAAVGGTASVQRNCAISTSASPSSLLCAAATAPAAAAADTCSPTAPTAPATAATGTTLKAGASACCLISLLMPLVLMMA